MRTMSKLIVLCAVIILLAPSLSYGALTKEDIEEIRKIVTESENRIRQEMDIKIGALNIKIEEMDKRLSARIDGIQWVLGILSGIVALLIGLPQVINLFRERAEGRMDKRIEQLEKEMESFKHEIESLKSRKA
jgi:hypothetical protein